MAGDFFICHTQNRNVDMTRLNEVLSQAQYKQIGGNQHGSNIRSLATNFSVHMCVGILVLGREGVREVMSCERL